MTMTDPIMLKYYMLTKKTLGTDSGQNILLFDRGKDAGAGLFY